jgi:hypothetical protein
VEKTDRVLEKATVDRRCHGEGGRWVGTIGHGGDASRRPTPGCRGGVAERCRPVVAHDGVPSG